MSVQYEADVGGSLWVYQGLGLGRELSIISCKPECCG